MKEKRYCTIHKLIYLEGTGCSECFKEERRVPLSRDLCEEYIKINEKSKKKEKKENKNPCSATTAEEGEI